MLNALVVHKIISLKQKEELIDAYQKTKQPLYKLIQNNLCLLPHEIASFFKLQIKIAEGELLLRAKVIRLQNFENLLYTTDIEESLIKSILKINPNAEKQILEYFYLLLKCDYQNLGLSFLTPAIMAILPPKLIIRYQAIPVFKLGIKLIVAMINPKNLMFVDDIARITKCQIFPVKVTETAFQKIIKHEFSVDSDQITEEMKTAVEVADDIVVQEEIIEENTEKLLALSQESPIIRLVNRILALAISKDASDIHIEPRQEESHVRFRIDGVLYKVMNIPRKLQPAVISRIKTMSSLDIAEKRIPQDGRLRFIFDNKPIDLRVSTVLSRWGEAVVMRLIDRTKTIIPLAQLGMPSDLLKEYEKVLSNPKGIIFVTGPTGSGKTTTLYASLRQIMDPNLKVISVEDPIEYDIDNVVQLQVNNKAGVSFAKLLRAILRQDPDIIMIGEVRDEETANMAIEAALTGHLVLTSFHTNDSVSTITRLLEMGIEPFLIASTITGAVAQRLVRKLCQVCKVPYIPSSDTLQHLGLKTSKVFKAVGCPNCDWTGYKGRIGIYELFTINDQIKDMIIKKESSHLLRVVAIKNGLQTLDKQALKVIEQGISTVEELSKIILSLEESPMTACPKCNNIVSKDYVACPFCQHKLKNVCSNCGFEVDGSWLVCPKCSERLIQPDILNVFKF